MNISTLRVTLQSPEKIQQNPFDVLKQISCLVADTTQELHAHEMVLRALEFREHFEPYQHILDSLVRSIGLFPYLELNALSIRDSIAYEFHRPENMGEEFVFHREQAEIYRRLIDGDSVILSAPTSFGKSKIIDAIIASFKYKNIVIVVPTLALIDETRRRLAHFADSYKIINHLSQLPEETNIFIFTAERVVAYEMFPSIDFFVIDEFYKIDIASDDSTRAVAINHAFYKLLKFGGQFYLLGPMIDHVTEGIESKYKCTFYHTKYTTVVTEPIKVPNEGDDIERLTSLCRSLSHEPTLIFCQSPARVNKVAHALIESGVGLNSPELQSAADWIGKNYHLDWVFGKSLTQGIGIHHGKLPRALAQYVVRMFNENKLQILICTSTLIEGVNTKAKNVVVFDNKIARRKIDFFTFNNISGRSGRMFEHFIGRVYIFNEPPTERLPFVDFPLYSQIESTPDSLLIQMEDEDLSQYSRERMSKYHKQEILPLSVLQENSSIDPHSQIELAKKILETPFELSQLLSWKHFPTHEQLNKVCDLIWTFLAELTRKGGVFSAKQLAFKIDMMRNFHDTSVRVLKELEPGNYAAKTPDEAVERVLDFERTWASFELPRYLMALSRIQRAVLEPMGLPYGDYSFFASQVECYFKTPVIAALDEYGIPLQLGMKLSELLGETDNLDAALAKLKKLNFDAIELDDFEKELLEDAKQFLP